MKRLLILCAILSAIAFNASCKKKKKDSMDSPEETPVPAYPSYSALKVGNYWIYQRFETDQQGQYQPRPEYDSTYVVKDTLIRNHRYYKIRRFDFLFQRVEYLYLRDSLHYIVNSGGGIMFSSRDFTTVFNTYYPMMPAFDTIPADTIGKVVLKMYDVEETIITPAGTFITSDARETNYMYPKYQSLAGNPRYRHNRYAKNIGLIAETEYFFLSSPLVRERRLIRYHIN